MKFNVEYELFVEELGLNNTTRVIDKKEKRILETQGLDIHSLCAFWREYYNIPFYYKIILYCNKSDFDCMQRKQQMGKSLKELFERNRVYIKENKYD